MCGRYSVSSPAQLVQEAFEAEAAPASASELLKPRWNVAPTQEAPVVRRRQDGGRTLDLLRWGMVPGAAARASGAGGEHATGGRLLINARAETAASLPAFRDSFRTRRCLVPADGFYEWRREGRVRQPFHIRFHDRRLLAFAGLWTPWTDAADGRGSFTILTCPPAAVVAPLHDRMPVILPPEGWEPWLLPDTDAEALAALLVPVTAPGLEAIAVDPWVNKADHEGERCVRPVDLAPAPRQLSLL